MRQTRQMEILAPAGGPEALERAIAAGADAVYLGFSAFSARAGAGNFDEAALRAALELAHFHGVRIHVAVNTLLKDGELPEALAVLELLNRLRADAVLIQDLGLLRLARACFPALPLHASTQMAIHNAAGVRWCLEQGMKRVVLARECSLAEIARAAELPIEIEVFAHGAQCVAVSGECLFSSMAGGRSGNRGRCAQPCRMRYRYRGREGGWLSPRDLCLRNELPAVAETGAMSLKIEGRLKRPEYVAVTARSYRQAADSLARGRFEPADAAETDALRQIFHRGGFMTGHMLGQEDAAVIEPGRVNHGGLRLGAVLRADSRFARVKVERTLHNDDELRLETAAGDAELRYAGPEVPAGGEAVLRLRPEMRVKAGDAVWRLIAAEQLREAMAIPLPEIPADMALEAWPGQPLRLTLTDGARTVTVSGPAAEAAQGRPLTAEDAARSLGKTGGTGFAAGKITVRTAGAFVPVSVLNNLRREGLAALRRARTDAFARAEAPAFEAPPERLPAGELPDMLIFRHPAQLPAELPDGLRLIWYPEDFRPEALAQGLAALPEGVWLHLPMVCEEETLQGLRRFAQAQGGRLGGVVLGSVGQLGLDWGLPVGAGSGVPVMNRRAAEALLEAGCAFVTASPELNQRELAALLAGNPPVCVPAYGRTQLMLLHHCPARTFLGKTAGHADCRLCDSRSPDALAGTALTGQDGRVFPLERLRLPEGCLVRLLNERPTDVTAAAAPWPRLLELTEETQAEAAAVLRCLREGGNVPWPVTGGHWKRGVQ